MSLRSIKTTPFLEYIVYDIFGEGEPVTFRAMMGAHVLYYEGKAFAIVEKEELYFKGSKELMDWYLCAEVKYSAIKKRGKKFIFIIFLYHLKYMKVKPLEMSGWMSRFLLQNYQKRNINKNTAQLGKSCSVLFT